MRRHRWIAQQHGRKAVLYVVRLFNQEECFFKVGVTFDLRAAFAAFRPCYGRQKLIRYASRNAAGMWDLAKKLCRENSCFRYEPLGLSDKTRCYRNVAWLVASLPQRAWVWGSAQQASK